MRMIPIEEFEIDLDKLKAESAEGSTTSAILLVCILIVGGFVLILSASKLF